MVLAVCIQTKMLNNKTGRLWMKKKLRKILSRTDEEWRSDVKMKEREREKEREWQSCLEI